MILPWLFAVPALADEDPEQLTDEASVTLVAPSQGGLDGPSVDLDVGLGLMVHTDALGIGTRMVAGAGWTPTGTRGRLRLHSEVGWARAALRQEVADPRFPAGVQSHLGVHRVDLGAGAGWSLVGDGADLDIEMYVTPRLGLVHSHSRASADDERLGTGRETSLRPMLSAGIGVTGPVARGEGCAQLGLTLVDQRGVQAGPARAAQIAVLFRYRPTLTQRFGAR